MIPRALFPGFEKHMNLPFGKATCLSLCLLLAAATDVVSQAPRRPPNIVFVVIDDYGWADSGCYGSVYHRTPHIDRLAARGMRFTDAYAAAPVCSPTRATLMTGKHPARLHLTDWLPGRRDLPAQMLSRPNIRQELPLAETTLAEALQTAGMRPRRSASGISVAPASNLSGKALI